MRFCYFISMAALLTTFTGACNRPVDEKKMREIAREEVRLEVARQLEAYRKELAKQKKRAEKPERVTPQELTAAIPERMDPATRRMRRRERDVRRFARMSDRISRMEARLKALVDRKEPKDRIARLTKSIQRLKKRYAELKARLADPTTYSNQNEPVPSADTGDTPILKLDEHVYAIRKSRLPHILQNLGKSRDSRVRPYRDGGFLVSYTRRPSALYKLGIRTGDIVKKLNGISLDSVDAALKAITTSKSLTSHKLTLIRQGKPLTLTYKITTE